MAERLDTLIQDFEFLEDNRALITLVGSVRLVPKQHKVELKADSNNEFPITGDHYVIAPLFQPTAVRKWLGFQAFVNHVKDGLTQLTGEGFRLYNGTNQYWWNGSSWVINTTSWNTETEIAANIATFSVAAQKIAPVIRLTTTNKRKTPNLTSVKISWSAKVQYIEDLLFRTLVPLFKGLRPLTDYAFKVPFPGGTALNVGAAVDASGTPFNIAGTDSIFDHTADPQHLSNLLSSYDVPTRIATLSAAIPVGNYAYCQLQVEPEVAVNMAHQDFIEVERAPAIIIQSIKSVDSSPLSQDDHVVNKTTGAAVRVLAPYRFGIEFTMIALAPGAVDLMRLVESIVELLENNQMIRSPALDRKYRLLLMDELEVTTKPNKDGLHSSQGRFVVKDVLAWKKTAQTEQAIQKLKLRGSMNTDVPFTP